MLTLDRQSHACAAMPAVCILDMHLRWNLAAATNQECMTRTWTGGRSVRWKMNCGILATFWSECAGLTTLT